jgi:hypothetical protein
MILKINGSPISESISVCEDGLNFNLDLCDLYDIVHTPVNVDISYNGHNIINGDINTFNWAQSGVEKIGDGIGLIIDHLF